MPLLAPWIDDQMTLGNMAGIEPPGVKCAARPGHQYVFQTALTLRNILSAGECCNACKVRGAGLHAWGRACALCVHVGVHSPFARTRMPAGHAAWVDSALRAPLTWV